MTIAIIGASAGLGRALAEEAARRGHDLFLCASDERDLESLAADLRLRYAVNVRYGACDLGKPVGHNRLIHQLTEGQGIDALLFPAGVARDDDTGILEETDVQALLNVNFCTQVTIITGLWPHLAQRVSAHVIGFGSIASSRGRSRNVVYAAAKRALTSYFESLRHLSVGTGIHVALYELGYMRTQQTVGKRLPLPMAPPERVARYVFDRLGRERGARFYPRFWAPVSFALRILPWTLFKRLKT
jgi:short-subunit dehydrogenase